MTRSRKFAMHNVSSQNTTAPLTAIIVGTGFAGIGMAIALHKAGITNFKILEKAHDVGGVWRDNSYPGAACDVPSHLLLVFLCSQSRLDTRLCFAGRDLYVLAPVRAPIWINPAYP